jgi:hypothetical protein
MQHPFWKWFWRVLGLIAAAFMFCTTLLFWTAWRASSFKAAATGQELQNGIDVVAIQLDILSLVIAVVAVGLGVAGFVGYQAIREGAVRKAQEAAENEVRIVAPPLIRREVAEFMRAFPEGDPISEIDVDAMVAAAGADGKEGEDGK